jgi:hypothetical protein
MFNGMLQLTLTAMKKLIFVLCLMGGVIATGKAQDTLKILQYPEQDQDLIKIEIRELPEMARQTLGSPDYSSWMVKAAYKTSVVDPNHPEDIDGVNYLVELKNGKKTKTVRFDKDGNKLKEDDGQN